MGSHPHKPQHWSAPSANPSTSHACHHLPHLLHVTLQTELKMRQSSPHGHSHDLWVHPVCPGTASPVPVTVTLCPIEASPVPTALHMPRLSATTLRPTPGALWPLWGWQEPSWLRAWCRANSMCAGAIPMMQTNVRISSIAQLNAMTHFIIHGRQLHHWECPVHVLHVLRV